MKYIGSVCWIALFLSAFSNIAIAASEKLSESQWRESVDARISEVTQSCHKTKDYQRYLLEGSIQKNHQKLNKLKALLVAMRGTGVEEELQENIKENTQLLLQAYAKYQKLGGVLVLSEVKSAGDPCEQKIADELKKLSYVAPVDARSRHHVNPVYPRNHRRRGDMGSVELAFIVDATGKARQIQVISTTSEAFSRSAKKALEASTFYVSMKNGKPFAKSARKKYYFILDDAEEAE